MSSYICLRHYYGLIPAAAPTPAPRPVRYYKTMQSLAAITASVAVPAHGMLVSGFSHQNLSIPMRSQIWTFFKQLLRGCAWAAAIAAGMLVYTAFTAKWKENGFPTIPISALVAIDQATSKGPAPNANVIGIGGGSAQNSPRPANIRQTSLIDLEYEG